MHHFINLLATCSSPHILNAHFVFQAGNIANISSSLVNLALILLMGQVYTALAEQLTKWGKNPIRIRPHKARHAWEVMTLNEISLVWLFPVVGGNEPAHPHI